MKKSAFFLPLLILVLFLSACGSNATSNTSNGAENGSSAPGTSTDSAEKDKTAEGYVPTELTVQFVPSQNADTLEAKAKPLEKLLGDKLGIPVKVSVSTDYNTIIIRSPCYRRA